MIKNISSLTIILLISSLTLQINRHHCIDKNDLGHCLACFRAKPFGRSRCRLTAASSSDSCEMYFPGRSSRHRCGFCKRGYALIAEHDEDSGRCVSGRISRCIFEVSVNTQHFCFACENGFPNHDNLQTCEGWGSDPAAENCEWGQYMHRIRTNVCMKCKTGFVQDPETGKCMATALVGCLAVRFGQTTVCKLCDPWRGFRMINTGSCSDVRSIEGEADISEEEIRNAERVIGEGVKELVSRFSGSIE